MNTLTPLNFPTKLTLIRLIVSPLILPLLIVFIVPAQSLIANTCVAIFFSLLCLTDFFDGYIARKFRQETVFGKVLDPIADKFLVYSTLIALLAINKIYFYWVVILIGREFFVMGLRLIAAEYGIQVPVSKGGKLKTTVQMILLVILILNPYQEYGLKNAWHWNGIEQLFLGLTLFMSITSAYQYYRGFIKNMQDKLFP